MMSTNQTQRNISSACFSQTEATPLSQAIVPELQQQQQQQFNGIPVYRWYYLK